MRMKSLKDKDKYHDIYGKFLKQVMPEEFIPIFSYKSKLDLYEKIFKGCNYV